MIFFGKNIAQSIKNTNPNKIAVAYLGIEWKKYIDPKIINFIIISPTLGSNPKAIEEMVTKIGWDKIYFNESLHAKIYKSSTQAIIGSANLSTNGLSGNNLIECCVSITKDSELQGIDLFLEELKMKSIHDEKEKIKKLEKLKKIFSDFECMKENIARTTKDEHLVDINNARIHVCWGQNITLKYTEKAKKELENIQDVAQLNFHIGDDIKVGDYIVYWTTTQHNRFDQRSKPTWMYVDRVIENAVEDNDPDTNYTTLALQVSDADLSHLPALDKTKFSTLIMDSKFETLRDTQDGPWKTDLALSRLFIQSLLT